MSNIEEYKNTGSSFHIPFCPVSAEKVLFQPEDVVFPDCLSSLERLQVYRKDLSVLLVRHLLCTVGRFIRIVFHVSHIQWASW